MNKTEKEKIVKDLEIKLNTCVSTVFTEFRGINVKKMEELRKLARQNNVSFQVIKNTLAKRAYQLLDDKGFESAQMPFEGPTAIAFGWNDPIAPIKILSEFAKENPTLILKGGVIEGTIVTKEKITGYANLPTKNILLSQMLMGLQSPIRNIINILNAPVLGLLNCLKAIEQKNHNQ